jgi:hypothetical protein
MWIATAVLSPKKFSEPDLALYATFQPTLHVACRSAGYRNKNYRPWTTLTRR